MTREKNSLCPRLSTSLSIFFKSINRYKRVNFSKDKSLLTAETNEYSSKTEAMLGIL